MIRKCNEWEAYLERKKASSSSSRQKETQKRFYPGTTTSKNYQISKSTENISSNHELRENSHNDAQANQKIVIILPYYFLPEMGNASKAVKKSIPFNADPKLAWDRDISIFTHPISYFAKRSNFTINKCMKFGPLVCTGDLINGSQFWTRFLSSTDCIQNPLMDFRV